MARRRRSALQQMLQPFKRRIQRWAPPPLLCCVLGPRQPLFCVRAVDPEERGVRSCSPTCVYECSNKALLSLPLNTPVSTLLPLTSLFKQGPLYGVWSFPCRACLSWTLRQNALSIILLRLNSLTFLFSGFYPKHVFLRAPSEGHRMVKIRVRTPDWFSFSTHARVGLSRLPKGVQKTDGGF